MHPLAKAHIELARTQIAAVNEHLARAIERGTYLEVEALIVELEGLARLAAPHIDITGTTPPEFAGLAYSEDGQDTGFRSD